MNPTMKSSRLDHRTLNMIARGLLRRVDDTAGVQVNAVSILDGETKDNVERLQNYGFSSVPLEDTEAYILFPGGDRSAGVIVACDDRAARMTGLKQGEVCVYNSVTGDSIVLDNDSQITITTKRLIINAEENVQVNSEQTVTVTALEPVTINAAAGALVRTPMLRVEGDITATGAIVQGVP